MQAVSVRVLILIHTILVRIMRWFTVHTHGRPSTVPTYHATHKHVRENALLLSRRPYPETRPASASVRARADRMQNIIDRKRTGGGQHCISGEVAHDTSCRLADAIREAQTHWGRLPHSQRHPRATPHESGARRGVSLREAVAREAASALNVEVHGRVAHDLHDLVVAFARQLLRVVLGRLGRLRGLVGGGQGADWRGWGESASEESR